MSDRETDYKRIIANNITELRRARGITQIGLAELLNYSDKAVSKWERGESLPDITVLKQIADHFGVSVDYLLEESHDVPAAVDPAPHKRRKRFIIAGLSCMLAVLIATVVFVVLITYSECSRPWLAFVCAVPVCAVIALVFNSLWGDRKRNYPIISALVWSLIASVYLSVGEYNAWQLFLVGVPAQIIIILWSGLGSRRRKNAE